MEKRKREEKEAVRRYIPGYSAYRFIPAGKMRYSWETESYIAETEGDPCDRDTPSPFESRADCDTPSSQTTEEVKNEKKLTLRKKGIGREEESRTG